MTITVTKSRRVSFAPAGILSPIIISATVILLGILPHTNDFCYARKRTKPKEENDTIWRADNGVSWRPYKEPPPYDDFDQDQIISEKTRARFNANRDQFYLNSFPLKLPPIVIPASGNETATIIFLHGLRDVGEDWAPVFKKVRQPFMKVICPTANRMPSTFNGGFELHSWFDVKAINEFCEEDKIGIIKATKYIHDLLDSEIKNGTPSERIIIGGFGQGGALALHSALTYRKKLGAIIAISAWLPLIRLFVEKNTAPENRNIPVFQAHGQGDPIISYYYGKLTNKLLNKISDSVTFYTYNKTVVAACDEPNQDLKEFLEHHIRPT